MPAKPTSTEHPETHSAVADGIVSTFLDTLAGDEDLKTVAERLRKTLLENHSYSEVSLQSALFDEGTP
jgi:hypothetical protein